MTRKRGIGPDFFRDEDLLELDHWIRLFYVGIWIEAEDFGGFLDNHRGLWKVLLAGDTIPDGDGGHRPVTPADAAVAIAELHQRGKLIEYTANGKRYFWIKSWFVHNPSIDYPTPPKIPLPEWIQWHGAAELPVKESDGGQMKNRRKWRYELLEHELPA